MVTNFPSNTSPPRWSFGGSNQFCWNIIIFYSDQQLSKNILTRMKLEHARMTLIPSSTMKIIINFVDTSSFSTVTSSCQKTSLTRMKLGHARMTHIPSSMMKIIINLLIHHHFLKEPTAVKKRDNPRMKLAHARKTHIPSSIIKIIINCSWNTIIIYSNH